MDHVDDILHLIWGWRLNQVFLTKTVTMTNSPQYHTVTISDFTSIILYLQRQLKLDHTWILNDEFQLTDEWAYLYWLRSTNLVNMNIRRKIVVKACMQWHCKYEADIWKYVQTVNHRAMLTHQIKTSGRSYPSHFSLRWNWRFSTVYLMREKVSTTPHTDANAGSHMRHWPNLRSDRFINEPFRRQQSPALTSDRHDG